MAYWIMGALSCVSGLLGLLMASRTHDPHVALFGMLLASFAVLFCWWMIKIAFDRVENKPEIRES
jgi:hypothetical protein